MLEIIHIAFAQLHKSRTRVIVEVSDDPSIVQETAEKFRDAGYKVDILSHSIWLSNDFLARAWQAWQKHLEREAQSQEEE